MDKPKGSRRRKDRLAFHERNLRTSILSLLRREGSLPRVLIGEKLNITPAMVTRCVQRLKSEGFVLEEGHSKGSGGRMCRNVALNPKAGYVVGIEYNNEEIHSALVDYAGNQEKLYSDRIPGPARKGEPGEMLGVILGTIRKTQGSVAKKRPMLGVAVVDPGTVDTIKGEAIASNLLPKWRNVALRQAISERFNTPVHLSNTANAIFAAVDRLETNRRYRDALYIEYRDGIACAVKANGEQIFGSRGMAGEVTVLSGGPTRSPLRKGGPVYLEQSAGPPAVYRMLGEVKHPILTGAGDRIPPIRQILDLSRDRDAAVSGIIRNTWRTLGLSFGNFVNALNPEVIVLDPHFGMAGDSALEVLRSALREQMFPWHADRIEIFVSRLEQPAGPLGAALVLLDELTFSGTVIRKA